MNSDLLKLIEKLMLPLLFVYLGYIGYDYYNFNNDPQSPLIQKQNEVAAQKSESAKLQEKIQQAKEFYKTLEAKKAELRALAQQLQEMKASLSEDLDVASFIKMVNTEATRVGLRVMSLKPDAQKNSEYYAEQPFDMSFKGVYIQLLLFMERISKLEKIIRVESFDIKRMGPSTATYIEIDGNIRLKAYRYLASKADDLGKGEESPTKPTPAPSGTPPAAHPGGGT